MDRYATAASLGNAATERPAPEGDAIASMLADRADNLAELLERLRHFGNRLAGGVPTGIAQNHKDALPTPALPPINSRLRTTNDRLCVLMKDLSEEVTRLEGFA